MDKARIARIKNYVRTADASEAKASEHNWMAAELIWEEIDSGTSQKDIAKAIGKSEAHISFVKRCWELRVIKLGLEEFQYADLGSFYEFYNSAQVKGESAGSDREGSGDRKHDRREPDGDYTPSGLILQANSYIESLERNWDPQLLSDDDISRMKSMMSRIRALLRDIG